MFPSKIFEVCLEPVAVRRALSFLESFFCLFGLSCRGVSKFGHQIEANPVAQTFQRPRFARFGAAFCFSPVGGRHAVATVGLGGEMGTNQQKESDCKFPVGKGDTVEVVQLSGQ